MERLLHFILLMLVGLISVCNTLPGSNNVYNHNDDNKSSLPNNTNEDTQSVNDKVILLTKQLGALSLRRRDDYKMLEISLQKYVRKNSLQLLDIDIKNELNDLR